VSQENVEVVRRGNELLNRAEWDELFDLCDPELEFCDLRSAVDTTEVLRGASSVKALLITWSDALEDFGADVYDLIDADPFVICDVRWYGRGRESGAAIDARQADVYEVRNGRLIRMTLGYETVAQALKAVGLEE
jgi:ketosteroid isomerase-like protein